MSNQHIRVGFIGLNPDSHWAALAHVPALKSLADDYEIVGVANSNYASAQKTAAAFNLPYAFETPKALASSEDVDLVVVTVKVPHHLELVKTALDAGKHVYCEWPLGNGLAEAQTLAALAAEKGVVAAIGTQMRVAPELAYLKQLIVDGYVGKVLSSTLVCDAGQWGGETPEELYYLFDKSNGATMLSIPLAHTLAGFTDTLGDIAEMSAFMLNQRDTVTVTETGVAKPKTTEDQIMIHGQLQSGAAFSVHYRGGLSKGTNLLWEINGTAGDIQVVGDFGHGQMTQLSIRGAKGDEVEMQPLMPPKSAYEGWPETVIPRNVANIYALVAADIRTGSRTAPSFNDAVKLHQLIDAVEQSAQKKTRVSLV